MIACLFVWSCARLLVCSIARLLVCSFARLIACLLARLFACLLSFALLAFFLLACLLGSLKFVPCRLLDSSSRCSGARNSVLGGCLRAPRGVRELHMIVLEVPGELVEVFGGSIKHMVRRLHEHDMLEPSAFLSFPGGDHFPKSDSENVPLCSKGVES